MTPSSPIAFFAHHQGRGHANRIIAISECILERPIVVMTAAPDQFDTAPSNMEIIELPDMIGGKCGSQRLFAEPTPSVMHCVPLGVPEMRTTMSRILGTLDKFDPALFVVDVSAEIALLSRIASVPTVKIRMHGNRNDLGHSSAYESCVAMLAPFSSLIEQDDYPSELRRKTFYSGGLCTTKELVPSMAAAREKLGLSPDQQIFLAVAGSGGSGTPYASLTMGARAYPNALWLTVGPLHKEGHETDFPNLEQLGWVDNITDYLAAADVILASAGDNTVHEICRVQRPFICVPEWRYFDEQKRKAQELSSLGAALHLEVWPGCNEEWYHAIDKALTMDIAVQKDVHNPQAAVKSARWIEELATSLWN